jgi:UDP-glucose 4-epimerase
MPESVLITGGAGFVGQALVARCLADGHVVTVIDNLCAGNLDHLRLFRKEITFHKLDILDVASVRVAMEEAKPEIVFHLAAHHFIPFCNSHPQETLRVNVEGSYTVLSEAARLGTHVAVLTSSGALYPSQTDPLSEGIKAAPVDIYGLSKQLMEQAAQFIANTSNMTCVAARLFNVYGPHETNPHLIPEIIAGLHRGSVVRLGNIDTKRDYIYVEDAGDLLYECSKLRSGYSVVNVGTGSEYSAQEIVDTIARLLGSEVKIDIDDSRKRAVDKMHQRADTRRLESFTGARARISLAEGLGRLLAYEGITATSGLVSSY